MFEKVYYILAINPGSTSTKLAIYKNEEMIYKEQINYSAKQITSFNSISQQLDMRENSVREFLNSIQLPLEKLSAVVGRGGVIVPVKSGAYEVNELMLDRLKNRPLGQHASNLGGMIAYNIAKPLGIKAYVYDGVSVSELQPLAYLTGFSGITRQSRCHALNMRAMAIKEAKKIGRNYKDVNLIVAHMGGGITLSVHEKGKMVDVVLDSEGPMTPERAGRLPLSPLIYYCIDHNISYKQLFSKIRGGGGLVSLLGTNDALAVEKMIDNGSKKAALVYETMAYQISKSIGELATVTKGKVDKIVLTGAMAYSKRLTNWITERVQFIADVDIIPGEDELQALSLGVLRVLRGEEEAHIYDEATDSWDKNFTDDSIVGLIGS
ncbi:butyrate kinase [Tepidanaerobacter acetatoxydans]|uniref:butyrate kinase n=1 Tax=Tepidanaerobacter acetatoxydans TaxID=499229 RepID=UPI001BD63E9B|nr:butyrate kinase [Tepidanaerobacter acetatoxydans]